LQNLFDLNAKSIGFGQASWQWCWLQHLIQSNTFTYK
jgi:hypothetical protein